MPEHNHTLNWDHWSLRTQPLSDYRQGTAPSKQYWHHRPLSHCWIFSDFPLMWLCQDLSDSLWCKCRRSCQRDCHWCRYTMLHSSTCNWVCRQTPVPHTGSVSHQLLVCDKWNESMLKYVNMGKLRHGLKCYCVLCHENKTESVMRCTLLKEQILFKMLKNVLSNTFYTKNRIVYSRQFMEIFQNYLELSGKWTTLYYTSCIPTSFRTTLSFHVAC